MYVTTTLDGNETPLYFHTLFKIISGAPINEKFMDMYMILLWQACNNNSNTLDFFLFPCTFASFSLFSLTPSAKWALEIDETVDNYIKFFPFWKMAKFSLFKTFLWPYCLDDNVWMVISCKEEEHGMVCEFYHPFGKSMYDFLYIMR